MLEIPNTPGGAEAAQPDRRHILRTALGAALGGACLPPWLARAQGQDQEGALGNAGPTRKTLRKRALVVVQLVGGNDGLNTLVPHGNPAYRRLRPNLGLATESLLRPRGSDGAQFGWHPALSNLAEAFDAGEVAAIQQVGYPQPNLSHFRSQDIWDTGVHRGSLPGDGWLGRATGNERPALALGAEVAPLAVQPSEGGGAAVRRFSDYDLAGAMTRRDEDPARGRARARVVEHLHRVGGEDPLRDGVARSFDDLLELEERLQVARGVEFRGVFPNNPLGRDLQLVAQLLGSGHPSRVYHVSQATYDTHTDQLRDHGRLLGELDGALGAFRSALRSLGVEEDVLVLTTSEFGRRPAESGIGRAVGSDHGTASVMLLWGGRVRPGIHGGEIRLDRLDGDGNPPFEIDFRSVYASLLEGWLGLDADHALRGRFPRLDVLDV